MVTKLNLKENDYSEYQKHWDDVIDVDGIKYNYDNIVDALLYMYGLDTTEKAAEAYISGKFTDREIKRALIYWDTQGLPWKERNVIFDRTCKKLHLEQIVKVKEDYIDGEYYDQDSLSRRYRNLMKSGELDNLLSLFYQVGGDFDEFAIEAIQNGFSKLDIMAFGLCVEEMSISTLKNRFKLLHLDNYDESIRKPTIRRTNNESVEIEVKHEGVLEVPEGKNVDELPIKHFVALANKKGLSKITKALNNLQVWNKNKDPKLSKWAGDMIDKVTKRIENQKESIVKERFSRREINSIISQMEELGFEYDGTDIKGWLLFNSWDDNSTQAFPDWDDVQDYLVNGNTSFEF